MMEAAFAVAAIACCGIAIVSSNQTAVLSDAVMALVAITVRTELRLSTNAIILRPRYSIITAWTSHPSPC